ncbi:endonuclease/exonuclease/phosphatase family protein [uncultured Gulosibacter sp.]|uniref:endonuclease/exonuclease/phosphatase family protein n=1 Tax=uncultured Gulosibacter sp. TaxID=1339167 RepID=UPI00288AE7A3|nr:endonuclease/exonuclease/phosphatase family protein [uncultured Gulosibacter sp.]
MKLRTAVLTAAAAALALSSVATTAVAEESASSTESLKVATFNASLNRNESGQLQADLGTPDNEQAQNIAETIQRTEPDVVLINEFDYDAEGKSVQLFSDNYLKRSQNGAPAIDYPYSWSGPVNTGVPSGFDLNNDGKVGGPDDAFGFGLFPGQYGFVVYSKYPISTEDVRTFQNFLWKDMPGAYLPENPDGTPWYSEEELAVMPLSSKTHADIPVDVNGTTVHVLAAHPTPPSFDGEEKRNQKRNHDEIRIWSDYVSGNAEYLYDDKGVTGGLAADANFVIVGDYNADPFDGDSWQGAIDQLLKNDNILDPMPTSAGGVEAAGQGGANATHVGDPKYDTADFNDSPAPGNLRVDYVLANSSATAVDAGVFWPTRDDELFRLTGEYPFPTSDHRLVWVNFEFPAAASATPEPTETPLPPATETETSDPTATAAPAPETTAATIAAPVPATTDNGRQDAAAKLATTGASGLSMLVGAAAAVIAAGVAFTLRRRNADR